jgi:hypothetical protein
LLAVIHSEDFTPNPKQLDGVGDMSELTFLEERNILHNLDFRYRRKEFPDIYTSIQHILVSFLEVTGTGPLFVRVWVLELATCGRQKAPVMRGTHKIQIKKQHHKGCTETLQSAAKFSLATKPYKVCCVWGSQTGESMFQLHKIRGMLFHIPLPSLFLWGHPNQLLGTHLESLEKSF